MTYIILLSFFLYVWLTSILPALSREKVSKSTKKLTERIQFTSNVVGPDRASAIIHPADAFQLRIEMIQAAKDSIDLVVDKIRDSKSTRIIFEEIYTAAKRGVQVNVMVNGLTYFLIKNQGHLQALNSHDHITFWVYNPVNVLKPSQLQMFLHDKLLLVDNEYLLLGSRNMDERYFQPAANDESSAHAVECFVVNTQPSPESKSVIDDVREYLRELYASKYAKKVEKIENTASLTEIKAAKGHYSKTNSAFSKKTLEIFIEETVPTNKITLLHNPVNTQRKEPVLGYQLRALAYKAKEKIEVHTPHLTGNPAIMRALKELSARVKVTVQTNSAASTPNLFAFSNYYGNREDFVQTDAQFYEFQSENSLHSNVLMIDQQIAAIGSFNLSDRSLYINTESMLVIDSKAFAARLQTEVEVFKKQSLRVGADNDYIDSETVEEISISFPKKVLLFVNFYVLKAAQFLAAKKDEANE